METAAQPFVPPLAEPQLPPVPSILAYTQPVAPRMPTAYYPGPGPMAPVTRSVVVYESDSDSGSDSDSDSDDGYLRARRRKILLAVSLAIAVVLIIMILYYMFAPRTLARSLTRCGWTVYLMKGCGYCRKQMSLLNGFDRYILCSGGVVIDGYTDTPPLACNSIKAFPYWYNVRTGEARTGFQDSAALARMAQW